MAGDHPRNTGPMLSSPRCGAKTRSGAPCKAPTVRGKKRCRMHGGARGSGAPRANQNAVKYGRYRREAIEERASLREFLKMASEMVSDVNKALSEAEPRRRK
jgi:uncharacterized protein YjcR